jgi:hypothetical protein
VFITSDSGFGVLDRTRDNFRQVSVLGSPDARLLMPIAREYCLQIGPIGRAATGVSPSALTPKETSLVNLAVYAWAGQHIFADTQKTATDVRRASKRAPQLAPRPRPFTQHVLIERDPDDDSLAQGHRKVGRAPCIEHDGVELDYVILRDDDDLPREALRALGLSKLRAHRRTGTTDLRSRAKCCRRSRSGVPIAVADRRSAREGRSGREVAASASGTLRCGPIARVPRCR